MTPRTQRARNGLFAAGLLFVVLGLTQGRSVFTAVGIALVVAGVVRGRRDRNVKEG
jgi:hypothetical protein